MKLKYVRLYADAGGESHFADFEMDTKSVDFAPPAAPMLASEPVAASWFLFVDAPSGWYGDWHPAPHRQFMLFLRGEVETTTSDGEVRRFRQGDAVLVEDTVGKGHITRSVGGDVLMAVTQLD